MSKVTSKTNNVVEVIDYERLYKLEQKRVNAIRELAYGYSMTKGGDRKQYALNKILECILSSEELKEIKKDFEDEQGEFWDEGKP